MKDIASILDNLFASGGAGGLLGLAPSVHPPMVAGLAHKMGDRLTPMMTPFAPPFPFDKDKDKQMKQLMRMLPLLSKLS